MLPLACQLFGTAGMGQLSWRVVACVVLMLCVVQQQGFLQAAAKKTNQEVTFAPVAELLNDIDDLSLEGNCAPEIKQSCSDVTAGEGRLADCLSDEIAESETADTEDSGAVSDACREEVYQYKITRNSNINLNVPLAKACKVDADQFCNVTWFFGYKAGQVISCLRDVKDRLAPACQREVFKVQMDAAEDYRADAALYEACKTDAENLCADVKLGGGRVQGCLRDKRMQLSWACEEQLFRQEMENSDDIRLSVRLFSHCIRDKRRFCADMPPGQARVKECLEEHRNEEGFTAECKEEIEGMIERRVHDFRLDSRLRANCEADIYSMCAFFGDFDSVESDDSSVIRCLQDYANEITSPTCKQMVLKYQELASQDIRFDAPLADACFQDRRSFCASVPPGSARVIRCLMKQREKLSAACRAVLFDEEVRFSQNIDFQFPLKKACTKEIQVYCKDIPPGEARVIRCLQDHKSEKDFSRSCKDEVREYESGAASDYRLNHRLSKACKADVDSLCASSCNAEEGQVCGGTVLRCLTEKRDQIKNEVCKKEVLYFTKMEVTDYRNDVILAAACRADVDKFCAGTEPGEGRVHECLRGHRDQLSDACRKEELFLEELEAENIELRPGVIRTCKDERNMFCKDVVPGSARVFRCLAEKMGDSDFGEACRQEVYNKLQRRQANWRLDPPLRKACKEAVHDKCEAYDKQAQEKGAVYKCLMTVYDDLPVGCQKELGRALHMALFAWAPQAILTSECDEDVRELCLAKRPNMGKTPGAVGQCLAEALEAPSANPGSSPAGVKPHQMSDHCRAIVDVAEPPNIKQAFDASLSVLMLQSQLSLMEGATGLTMMSRDRSGQPRSVTLTGWTAVLGMAAMVVLVIYGGMYAYRKYRGVPDGRHYDLVVKQKHPPSFSNRD